MSAPFKLGRNRPEPQPTAPLAFGDYLTAAALPAPPPSVFYGPKAAPVLSEMLGNDQVGNCVEAGMLHAVGVWEDNAGRPTTFTTAQAIALYSAITGYDPKDPSTDQGTDEITAFKFWQRAGIVNGQHKILGWAKVDGLNKAEVMTALWLFENLVFGVELPDAWVNPFPSSNNFIWDAAGAPNPQQGHCFVGHGYTAQGVRIATWGMRGLLTWAAVEKYATTMGSGELYAVLSADALATATGKAPNGFDAAQLAADLQAIGQA